MTERYVRFVLVVCAISIALPVATAKYGWAFAHATRPGFDAQFNKYKNILKEAKMDGEEIPIIFYGDSVTECLRGSSRGMWRGYCKGISAVFHEYFRDKYPNALVAGMGGDKTSSLMWRLLHGNAPVGVKTKVVSVLIGSNDLNKLQKMDKGELDEKIEETYSRITQIAEFLLTTDSKPWVFIQAIFYEAGGKEDRWSADQVYVRSADAVNAKLAAWAATQTKVKFVDCNKNLLTADGKRLDKSKYADVTHMSPKGWTAMAKCFAPHIYALMDT